MNKLGQNMNYYQYITFVSEFRILSIKADGDEKAKTNSRSHQKTYG